MSLLYKNAPALPRYKYENLIYEEIEETRGRWRRGGSKSGSKGDDSDDEAPASVSSAARGNATNSTENRGTHEYFVPFAGTRLVDTTVLLPPVPFYMLDRGALTQETNPYFNCWAQLSYAGTETKRCGIDGGVLSANEHFGASSAVLAVDDFVLSHMMAKDRTDSGKGTAGANADDILDF